VSYPEDFLHDQSLYDMIVSHRRRFLNKGRKHESIKESDEISLWYRSFNLPLVSSRRSPIHRIRSSRQFIHTRGSVACGVEWIGHGYRFVSDQFVDWSFFYIRVGIAEMYTSYDVFCSC
jgi:hypothetical protein